MSKYTEGCIDASKKMIYGYISGDLPRFGSGFEEYSPFYKSTNEYIKGYVNLYDMSNYDSALTVLSSGDHAFNLIHAGIMDIDTFDCNKLTEYYALGLKRAMILKYTYREYLKVMSAIICDHLSFDEEIEMINDLLPFMDEEYRLYWKSIVNFAISSQKLNRNKENVLQLLSRFEISMPLYLNSYLNDVESYNLLKARLGKANISFACLDAFHLGDDTGKTYDVIMLSNILDYFSKVYGYGWKYSQLQEYESKLLPILKENGIAFLTYIFKYSKDLTYRPIIQNSSIRLPDIKGEHEEIVPFSGMNSLGTEQPESAMLVLKKEGDKNASNY